MTTSPVAAARVIESRYSRCLESRDVRYITNEVTLTSESWRGRPTDAACKLLMESANFKSIRTSIRRNLISVLFPTFAVLAIYADLRHTARWKRQLAEEQLGK